MNNSSVILRTHTHTHTDVLSETYWNGRDGTDHYSVCLCTLYCPTMDTAIFLVPCTLWLPWPIMWNSKHYQYVIKGNVGLGWVSQDSCHWNPSHHVIRKPSQHREAMCRRFSQKAQLESEPMVCINHQTCKRMRLQMISGPCLQANPSDAEWSREKLFLLSPSQITELWTT